MRGYPIASPVFRTPLVTSPVKSSQQVQAPLSCRRRWVSRALIQKGPDPAFEYDILDKQWDRESWKSAIKNPEEVVDGFWVKDIEGKIPKEMHGTYFKNVPAGIESHGVHVAHPFDAQGYIGSVAIKDGKAFFRSRFVKTKDYLREERAKRRLLRGVFGTGPKEGVNPLFKFKAKNAGNTNVALHQGKLYPLYEGSPSCELDPFTLETLYPTLPKNPIESLFRFVYAIIAFLLWILGKLRNVISGSKGILDFKTMKTSAHPHRDHSKNLNVIHRYGVNLGFNASGVGIKLIVYEFEDDLKITANTAAMMENKYGLVNCIEWDENGVQEIHLIPRPSSKKANLKHRVIKLRDQASFIFHFINAYESDDQFVIDAVRYPRLGPFKYTQEDGERYVDEHLAVTEPKPRVTRLVCDLEEVKEYRDLTSRAVELPSINPKQFGKPYRYAYMEVALHPEAYIQFQAIGKLDVETNELKLWTKDRSYFVGEHVFVPKPDGVEEDDGWIVGFDYDGTNKRTEFVILDAKHIEDGPIATLNLGLALPHGLHGIWTEEFYGPQNNDLSD